MILEEEEDVIGTHKSSLDDFVDSIKGQMSMIGEVDQPGSDIQNYVGTLSQILAKNIRVMTSLQTKVDSFGKHLKEEAELSNKYYSEKAVIDAMGEPQSQVTTDIPDDMYDQEDDAATFEDDLLL